jgi:hypothetical protein
MLCRGFYLTLQRGAEWAATGKVVRTAAVPEDFPTAVRISPVTLAGHPQQTVPKPKPKK